MRSRLGSGLVRIPVWLRFAGALGTAHLQSLGFNYFHFLTDTHLKKRIDMAKDKIRSMTISSWYTTIGIVLRIFSVHWLDGSVNFSSQ